MIATADLAALYDAADGLTVSATFGAETTQVHFRQGAIDALGGDRLMSDYSIRYRASTLSGLTKGSAVVIDGVTYIVRVKPAETPSGAERVALLTRSA